MTRIFDPAKLCIHSLLIAMGLFSCASLQAQTWGFQQKFPALVDEDQIIGRGDVGATQLNIIVEDQIIDNR